MKDILFFEINEPLPEYVTSINRLIRQLSTNAKELSVDDLAIIVNDCNSHLYLLSVDGTIAGMCTLAVYNAPTGRKAWIEDVVVDSEYRGNRLGRLLVDKTIGECRRFAPCTLMLTSRPARVAANCMYKSAGFNNKTTNVYTMKITQPE